MAEHNPIVGDEYLLPTNFVSVECPNWINQNQMMDGNGIVPLPLMLQSEGLNNFVSMANFGSQPVDSSTVKEFSGGNSYPINGAQIHNDFRAAYFLAARNGGYDNNPEKFAALPYSTNISYSNDVFDPSSQELGSFPVDLTRKCDEMTGTVIGRATGSQPFQLLSGNMISPGVWFSAERPSSSSNNSPSGSSRFSNELSLSLTTTPPPCIQDQFSELSCSGVTTNPFREQAQAPKNLSLNFDSYKPLQLSQFLSGSRYLAVMQDILSQIAKYSLENLNIICYDDGEHSPFSSSCSYGPHTSINRVDAQTKRKHLLALLQAVDDRYSQCLDELHMVVSAFHAVTELHPSIHTHFALQTVSFLYKKLRERISTFILAMGEHSSSSNRSAREENSSFEASFIQKQWTLQQLRKKDHQLWRPQRGLPERSVSVLRAWMFQNFLHPYPKDTEKHLLAVKSGLTRSQVSNWFINARVRLWKPMIEEMYAEMNRRNHQQNDEKEEMNGCRNRRVLG